MDPEEFVACLVAIHRYLKDKESLVEIGEIPRNWKFSGRVRD
ncbi:MAG: hypothetical protein QXQ38_02495 [Archaeoglobaceae archaeon]|nr:hypothetical protein [Archaeoglobales archaeon]MDI9643445.1 hypothetical protein [Archaeoglobales archaeon]